MSWGTVFAASFLKCRRQGFRLTLSRAPHLSKSPLRSTNIRYRLPVSIEVKGAARFVLRHPRPLPMRRSGSSNIAAG